MNLVFDGVCTSAFSQVFFQGRNTRGHHEKDITGQLAA